jgi:hypothetical protein
MGSEKKQFRKGQTWQACLGQLKFDRLTPWLLGLNFQAARIKGPWAFIMGAFFICI